MAELSQDNSIELTADPTRNPERTKAEPVNVDLLYSVSSHNTM